MRWLALIIVSLLFAPAAQATILFASGEDTGFTATGGAAGITTGGRYRATFARAAVSVNSTAGAADPPANRAVAPTFTAGSNIWVHGYFHDAGSAGFLNEQGLILRSPDGVSRIIIRQTGTYATIKIAQRNAAGTITDLATSSAGAFSISTLTQFDLNVNYTAAGGATLYINSVAVATFSGDPRTDSATQLSAVELAALNGSALSTAWSEVIVADQDTRGMSLFTMAPQASGNTQSWTPNTLANINKGIIADGTLITTTVNNALSEWTVPATAPTGSFSVLAVSQDARVEVGATGPLHFDWLTRVGGVDYLAGASTAPTTSFANYQHIWPTNPGTGIGWTISDITTAGFNLGIESLP